MADVSLFAALRKASVTKAMPRTLSGVGDSRSGWWQIFGSHVGFQTDVVVNRDSVAAQPTYFACTTLIKSDIGKLRPKLMELAPVSPDKAIWKEVTSPAFSPVLRKPNRYQTWQKFIEHWVLSLLSAGNAYILKERDRRGLVVAMYVLDPSRVLPMVSDDGSVYYSLQQDHLAHIQEHVYLPAIEVIHDRLHCLFHPLVGISPIFASGLPATQALSIQSNSAKFFENMSQPGGILTAPAKISDDSARRAKDYWENNFTGSKAGKVAVLGDGLTYQPMTMKPVDAQLVDQMKLSGEQICSTFHVPPHMVGAAPTPSNNNIEALTIDYYNRCLQPIIESIEAFLDEGLGLGAMKDGRTLGIELDLGGLLRMDTKSQVEVLTKASGGAYMKPDEARASANLPPVEGGNTLYKQHQDYSIAALAKRDAGPDPFGTAGPPAPAPGPDPEPVDDIAREEAASAKEAAAQATAAVLELRQKLVEANENKAREDAELAKASAAESSAIIRDLSQKLLATTTEKSEERSEAFMVKMFDKMASTFGVKAQEPEDDPDPFIEHFDSLEAMDA